MSKLFYRYKIQTKLKEVGLKGQEKLAAAKVAVVGLGGLGVPCCAYLAGAGVGKLILIDGDHVELSNLHRQVFYDENDVGQNKAVTCQKKIQKLNTGIKMTAIASHMVEDNLARILKDVDVILDCTDNFKTRLMLNHYSVHQNKIYVFASVDQWSGQAALFYPGGPCLNCLFADVKDGLFQDCNTAGVLGPVVGVVAQFQVQLVLNWILMGQKPDTLHLYHAKSLTLDKIAIQKRADCKICEKAKPLQSEMEQHYTKSLDESREHVLLDIRDREEFKIGALKGANNIPFMDIINDVNSTQHLNKDKTYVLYCANNNKTHFIRSILKAQGFESVFTLDRGFNEYKR